MPHSYCFRCKARREIKNPQEYTMKNGKPGVRGTCPVCGARLSRLGPLRQ